MSAEFRAITRAVSILIGCLVATFMVGAPANALVTDASGTLTVGGAATAIATTQASQNANVTFAGTAGQRIAVQFSSFAFTSCAIVTLKNPDNSVLRTGAGVCGSSFFEPSTLTTTGTYSIYIDPMGTATGSVAVAAYNVPADATGTLTVGGAPTTIATTAPAQNSKVTFAGTAGQRLALTFANLTYGACVRATVLKPDASVARSAAAVCAPTFFEPLTLTVTGTYTVTIDPASTAIGSVSVQAYNVPGNAAATLTVGGSAVTVTTTAPGQDAAVTFAGTAGQRVSLEYSANTFTGSCVELIAKNPDGLSTLIPSTGLCAASRFFEPVTLATTGTYTIAVNPRGTSTGSLSVRAYLVPADATTAMTVGGAAVTVSTTTPAQNAKFTFAGTAGQRVSFNLTGNTFTGGCVSTRVDNPDGSVLKPSAPFCGTTAFFEPLTLATTGTYTLYVDGKGTAVGSLTARAYLVPADATTALAIGGPGLEVSTTVPGQNAAFTFAGTAAQTVTLTVTGSTLGTLTATVRRPDNTVLTTRTVASSGDFKHLTLPATGTYTVTLDARGAAVGSATGALTLG